MDTRALVWCKFALFSAVSLSLSWPIFGEEMTNETGNKNTSLSKLKNQTITNLESCVWAVVRPSYSIIAGIISGFLILDGGILCSFGYSKERTTFSLLGFTVAGLVGYAIVDYKFDYSIGIQLLITGSMALFVSILSSSIMYCGIFLAGLCTGFSFGSVIIIIINEIHTFGSFAEPILILVGISIAFASMSLWWKRTFVILDTSVVGGVFVMGGIDYFVEGFLFVEHVKHIIYGEKIRKLCFFSWIVFSIFPLVAIAGLLIQHFKTAKRIERPKSMSNQDMPMNRMSQSPPHQSQGSNMESHQIFYRNLFNNHQSVP
ncbi:transmembrane protein 198-B-like isoform X2 [Dendronephthya gigantea]|uniref:transmembrane protein 198-B-like isoform X2 n=1 Tax=Dendronephthya gigantea TaxID=151771 RepID=UPI0010695386|nr:transmembrane protein 198-B-like isoform X2 [Dendronephthya gigantea]XP_028392177.1 transmembrane protein 198-B-like isoform X2 [Dendronephthya gigantea]